MAQSARWMMVCVQGVWLLSCEKSVAQFSSEPVPPGLGNVLPETSTFPPGQLKMNVSVQGLHFKCEFYISFYHQPLCHPPSTHTHIYIMLLQNGCIHAVKTALNCFCGHFFDCLTICGLITSMKPWSHK